jgi:hypothetical protein
LLFFAGNLQRAAASLPQKSWSLGRGADRKTAGNNPSILLFIVMN